MVNLNELKHFQSNRNKPKCICTSWLYGITNRPFVTRAILQTLHCRLFHLFIDTKSWHCEGEDATTIGKMYLYAILNHHQAVWQLLFVLMHLGEHLTQGWKRVHLQGLVDLRMIFKKSKVSNSQLFNSDFQPFSTDKVLKWSMHTISFWSCC